MRKFIKFAKIFVTTIKEKNHRKVFKVVLILLLEMKLYQELKIFTGLGQPDPAYVADQIRRCRDGITAYDSDIARCTASQQAVAKTHAGFENIGTVLSDDFINGAMGIYSERERAEKGKNKAEERLNRLEKIASRF